MRGWGRREHGEWEGCSPTGGQSGQVCPKALAREQGLEGEQELAGGPREGKERCPRYGSP